MIEFTSQWMVLKTDAIHQYTMESDCHSYAVLFKLLTALSFNFLICETRIIALSISDDR